MDFDETGSIGKRYRREDEIGTPYCITVDFDTVGDAEKAGDNCVTVRDRDTMEQVRLPIDQLKSVSGGETGILMPVSILLQNAAAGPGICRRQNLAGGQIHSARGMMGQGPAKQCFCGRAGAAAYRPAEELSGGETGILMPVSILLRTPRRVRAFCRRQKSRRRQIHSVRGMNMGQGPQSSAFAGGANTAARRPTKSYLAEKTGSTDACVDPAPERRGARPGCRRQKSHRRSRSSARDEVGQGS